MEPAKNLIKSGFRDLSKWAYLQLVRLLEKQRPSSWDRVGIKTTRGYMQSFIAANVNVNLNVR
ncbi:hypothetical protein [Alteribacillus sp. YIM 98480]|uniref:hypothetical protein n=1 Tax=Alteribacillus sp. YIM 98480 TaxID=2606599 RepID=UPI00131BD044|nr:hypothetical protein [Alteribacillus sp. YIM 98480]